jgi:rhodanese-related sulfurtransferase
LVDLRSAASFGAAFIPGSFSVPDLDGVAAARRSGLFCDREIYLLADDAEQLQLCSEWGDLGEGAELAGWFGPDALEEWRKAGLEISSIEVITPDTLAIRLAGWSTIVLDIGEQGPGPVSHPTALNFRLDDLPMSLDGLPAETAICLTADSTGTASFAASLLWNFGFHKMSYLKNG